MMPKLQSHTAASMQNEIDMMMLAVQREQNQKVDHTPDIVGKTKLAVNMRNG